MEIKEQYRVYVKDYYKSFPRWKSEDGYYFGSKGKLIGSLDQINKYFNRMMDGDYGWKLVDKRKKGNNLIIKLYDFVHPDSDFARNPGKYPDHFVSYKIVPVLSLEGGEGKK